MSAVQSTPAVEQGACVCLAGTNSTRRGRVGHWVTAHSFLAARSRRAIATTQSGSDLLAGLCAYVRALARDPGSSSKSTAGAVVDATLGLLKKAAKTPGSVPPADVLAAIVTLEKMRLKAGAVAWGTGVGWRDHVVQGRSCQHRWQVPWRGARAWGGVSVRVQGSSCQHRCGWQARRADGGASAAGTWRVGLGWRHCRHNPDRVASRSSSWCREGQGTRGHVCRFAGRAWGGGWDGGCGRAQVQGHPSRARG